MRVFLLFVFLFAMNLVANSSASVNHATPTASYTNTTVCQGLPTVFTNTSTTLSGSIVASIWDFGDGQGSTVFSPNHTYASSGTFNVTLAVINSQGDVAETTASVVVHPSGTLNFVASDAALCLDEAFTFTNLSNIVSGHFTSHTWDFGDGESASTLNATHQYTGYGTYTVTLSTTTNNNCTNSVSKTVEVYPLAVADFTATSVCFGTETVFTNQSQVASGLIAYDWSFGDGENSAEVNPRYEYASAGSQSVTLVATTDKGCVTSISSTVIVNPAPIASFSTSDHCFGEEATFENLSSISSGTLTHTWQFGDGATSPDEDGQHIYATIGNYEVTLTVTSDHACEASESKFVRSTPKPIPDFSTSNICFGQPASFVNASTIAEGEIAYTWDFGDGQVSALSNPSHAYDNSGTYDVTLTASTASGGCPQSVSKQIIVASQPLAAFQVSDNCLDSTFVFQNTSEFDGDEITYTWSFGDGQTYTGFETSHQYAIAQTYNAQLTAVADNGCSDSETKTLTVAPLPQINFAAANVCFGQPTEFQNFSSIASGTITCEWEFGDDAASDQFDPNHTYAEHGEYLVTLTAISDLGCAALKTRSIYVDPLPVPDFSAPSVCFGEAVKFTNTTAIPSGSIRSYQWDFGDESTSLITSPSKAYAVPAQYLVSLTAYSETGCEASVEKTVTVFHLPIADFSVEDVCSGGPVNIQNLSVIETGALTYAWDFGDMSNSVATAPSHTYQEYGVYAITLKVSSGQGCEDSITRPVAIFSAPDVDAGADQSVSQGYPVQLLARGAVTYRWEPIQGLSNSSIPDPIATPLVTTDYTVFGQNTFGCESSDTVRVTVLDEFKLVATNVLTPDENGSNDTWRIENVENFGSVYVRVYDRIGRLVFQQAGYQNDWRGNYGKDLLPDGTYYYFVTFSNSEKTYEGALTILRNKK